MSEHLDRAEGIKKVNELIKDIRIAMFTTEDDDGSLVSRPMATQEAEFDGELWFFANESSPKVDQIEQDRNVNLAYVSGGHNYYVSVSGTASVVHDRAKMEELWKPALKTWFPKGLEDPDIALLKVKAEHIQYWDDRAGALEVVAGFVKATVTGKPAQTGETGKIDL